MNDQPLKKSIIQEITSIWRAVFAALHFLTVIPSFSQKPYTEQELGRSVGYFPLIGGLIGLFLFSVDRLLNLIFPSSVAGALLIACWVIISGGIHLDGFLDSCDGLFGGANPEERLKIMRDEHIGAFALIGGILLIVIKIFAINSIEIYRTQSLFLSPIISRWGMSIAIEGFPYGRTIGLGKDIKMNAGKREIFIASLFVVVITYCFAGLPGEFIVGLSLLFIMGICRFITDRIPGLTGDSYGAINELVEVIVLLAYTIGTKIL